MQQIDYIVERVETLVRLTQKKHFAAFQSRGSSDYTELGHNLVALSKIPARVRKALEGLETTPDFLDYRL